MSEYILVTGGAGYIGSHVCKELAKNGYTPISFDNLYSGYEELVKWGPFIKGDILDNEHLTKIMKEYNPMAVIHMGSYLAAGESVILPGKYYHNNVFGSLSIIEAMKKTGVKNIVFSSTAAVYGDPIKLPIDENEPTKPINPYGKSKLFVENILDDFHTSDGINYVSLRYFNAAGADLEGETGSLQTKPSNLIPIIMDVLSGKKESLDVYGDDYDTPDGTAIRDYIHVTDLAVAHVKSLEYMQKNEKTNICLNLGTGSGYSVMEIIHAAEKVSNREVKRNFAPRRPGDAVKLEANANLAKEKIGWEAEITDVYEIVKSAWEWEKKRSKIK